MTAFVADKPPLIRLDSGEWLDLLAPDWRLIDLEEIAKVLSGLMRWNGRRDASGRPVSVAEHSLYVAYLVGKMAGPRLVPAALLHDAHEYVMGDLQRNTIYSLDVVLPGFSNALRRLRFNLDLQIARACYHRFDPPYIPDDLGYLEAARDLALMMIERPIVRADDMASHIEQAALRGEEPWPDQLLDLQPDVAASMWLHALEGAFGAGQ